MLSDDVGRPALPGSLVKGNLRHAWRELQEHATPSVVAEIDTALKLLGEPSQDSDHEPRRGLLSFSEYWSDAAWKQSQATSRRYRIAVDPGTGAVANGALQVIESPYPVGTEVKFTGRVSGPVTAGECESLRRLMLKGLLYSGAIGARKGVGFGRVEHIKVSYHTVHTKQRQGLQAPAAITGATRIGLRICPQESFCFALPAVGRRNHLQTGTAIPGGAIVAAIKRRIDAQPDRWPMLKQELDKLHITQATPVRTGLSVRPVALPLSLVQANGQYHDISGSRQWCLIGGRAPLFCIDWKDRDYQQAFALLNPGTGTGPAKRLHMRNEIDESKGTAKDTVLFSMETVIPEGFEWIANCDLSLCDQPTDIIQELFDLLDRPLTQLGKTKTPAQVTVEAAYDFSVGAGAPALTPGEQIVVYLQTAARLLPTGFQSPSANGGGVLRTAYESAWSQLSGGSLRLSHFYASQRLNGGEYWWRRFRLPDSACNGAYHPEILTESGSVFVFTVKNAELADSKLRRWYDLGLDQLSCAPGGEDWRYNPWIAANGYGEIAVNLCLHDVLGDKANGSV